MARDRHDNQTSDLLAWEPTPPRAIPGYDEERVRAASLRTRIAKGVAETLKDCDMPREEIARGMSEWLGGGETVTKHMLDAYASEGRESHTISYLRLLALVHVTGDLRLLQMAAGMFGHLVVDNKYREYVDLGVAAERHERIRQIADEADQDLKLAMKLVRRRS